jgi:uncharacterized protein YndB with AHSA1/START domain
VTSEQQRTSVVEFPSDLEVLVARDFDAPIELVFEVLTNPEHVRKTFAPYGEEVTVCSIDLRVGGEYRYVMVPKDAPECSFRGTFLEVDPPSRIVQTWNFDGWPGVEAVETVDLQEVDGVTQLRHVLAFRDQAGRDHMKKTDGLAASYDSVAALIESLVDKGNATDD